MSQALANSAGAWRIAFGHHTDLSNGKHGNAGNYEGLPFVPIVNGAAVQRFTEDHLCGNVDMYLCAHDHNRQWLEPTCGTEFIVSGAAAKTTDFEHIDGNPTFWEDDDNAGFVWIELAGDVMTVAFYDLNGTLEYTGSVTK